MTGSESALTTACSFGDVVLVPFPFTDQSGAKKRPARLARRKGRITEAVLTQVHGKAQR